MNKRSKRILLTGATGFLGRHALRHFSSHGLHGIAIFRSTSDRTTLDAMHTAEWEFVVHDGTAAGLVSLLRPFAVDAVVHLATCFLSEHQATDLDSLLASNVVFGSQVAEAAMLCGAQYFLNLTTTWQHGGDGRQPYTPLNLYAASKQAFEDILKYYALVRGLRVMNLEMCDTYGPGDNRQKVIPLVLKAMASGQRLAMSPGEQRIDLIHVDDAVEAVAAALKYLESMPIGSTSHFSVTSGTSVSLRDVMKTLGRMCQTEIPVDWGCRPYRPREVMDARATYDMLPKWRQRISLEEGLRTLGENQ